jgi:hypothetical protein
MRAVVDTHMEVRLMPPGLMIGCFRLVRLVHAFLVMLASFSLREARWSWPHPFMAFSLHP